MKTLHYCYITLSYYRWDLVRKGGTVVTSILNLGFDFTTTDSNYHFSSPSVHVNTGKNQAFKKEAFEVSQEGVNIVRWEDTTTLFLRPVQVPALKHTGHILTTITQDHLWNNPAVATYLALLLVLVQTLQSLVTW